MAGYARLVIQGEPGWWGVYLESDVMSPNDGLALRVKGAMAGKAGRRYCLRQARMLARRLGNIPVIER